MASSRDSRVATTLRCAELYARRGEASDAADPIDALVARLQAGEALQLQDTVAAVDVVLVHADALVGAAYLRETGVKAALAYIDPPYASHRDYTFAQKHPEDGSRVERVAFSDRWDGGMDAYVDALQPVIQAIYDGLTEEGNFLLHVDPRGAPYLAIRCDQIFGMGERLAAKHAPGFRNELIWSYGLGGSSPRSWPKKHDNILWYSKGSKWFFDPPMTPARSNRMRGMMKKQPDVIDIPTINNMAKDRTGYPTQKPLELLEMFVCAHAEAGALVMDLFSGSGTTALAAARSGRRAYVVDVAGDSIAVTRSRLLEEGFSVAVWRPATEGASMTVDAASQIFEREGALYADVFVDRSDGEKTHRLQRDVHGAEAISPRFP